MGRERRTTGRGLRGFVGDARGAATLEFVIWLPAFFAIFFAVVDLSVLYFRYGQMWDVARDAARQIALREMPMTEAALDEYVDGVLTADYDARLINQQGQQEFTVIVNGTVTTMSVFGFFSLAVPTMNAVVPMRREQRGAV